MPTLTINGQKVTVDESFDSLPPAQQEATIDEIAKSFGGGSAATAETIAAKPSTSLADAGRFGMTAAVRGLGGALDFLADPLAPLRRMVSPSMERIEQSAKPHLGEMAGNAVFGATGIPEYQPQTPLGRVGLGAAEGAVGGGPFGLVPALLSAAGGALGQGVMEAGPKLGISPENTERAATAAGFAPMGLAPIVRGPVNYAARQAREAFGPTVSEGYRQGLVGEQLRAAASDPEATIQSLAAPLMPELVPGSKPTTYQYTGDPGIGQLERGQRTIAPAPFLERAQEQNAARIAGVQDLAPGGAVAASVGDLLRQQLARVDAEGEANISRARQNALQALDQAGGRLNTEDYGALIRDQLETAKAATKQSASGLWQAIDPEGKLTIDATPVKREAAKILAETSKMARQPQGAEAEVFANARMLGSASPFSDFTALRGNLLQAIREERANGETPALRRMQMLRSAMDDTIAGTAERAAATDEGLVERLNRDAGRYEGGVAAAELPVATGGESGLRAEGTAGGPPAATGLPGAAGVAQGGPGGATGYSRIQEPPRPQDLIQFLRSRGGLKPDDGGELRAMDLHKGQGFARVVRPNGMALDEARELAVESGYLHPDSDINDLLNALRRNEQGQPVFAEGDLQALDWQNFDRSRRNGDVPFGAPEVDPLAGIASPPAPPEIPVTPTSPPAPANFGAEAAGRYRTAADAWRDMSERFKNQLVGPALAERGNEYRMIESRVPERFLSSPEGVQAFLNAGGNPTTLKDALVGDLRRAATGPDGELNLTKYQTWLTRRDAALRAMPDVRASLDNAAGAQESVNGFVAGARQARLEFEQSAARHFLNAEPVQAIQAALGGRNPVNDMAQIAAMVKSDPAAVAGLQRAAAEYIERNFIGNADALKSDAFQTFINRSGPALAKVFEPAQMQAMRNIAADLKRSNMSIAGSKIPGSPGTAQDLAASGRFSAFRAYLWPGTFGGAVGLGSYLIPGVGLVGAAVSATGAAKAVAAIKRAGLEKVDALRTEALLNPDVAAALMMKATPANRQFIAAKLNAGLGRIIGAGSANENLKAPPMRRAAQ